MVTAETRPRARARPPAVQARAPGGAGRGGTSCAVFCRLGGGGGAGTRPGGRGGVGRKDGMSTDERALTARSTARDHPERERSEQAAYAAAAAR